MIGASGESVFIRECADCTFYVACTVSYTHLTLPTKA